MPLFDFACDSCGTILEHFVASGVDKIHGCALCGGGPQRRIRVSKPAPYFGEKVYNVQICGGKHDTMGYEHIPPAPLSFDFWADGVNGQDIKHEITKPEYKNWKEKKKRIQKRNLAKRKRAAALERGEKINMRRDRCEGDPKI